MSVNYTHFVVFCSAFHLFPVTPVFEMAKGFSDNNSVTQKFDSLNDILLLNFNQL